MRRNFGALNKNALKTRWTSIQDPLLPDDLAEDLILGAEIIDALSEVLVGPAGKDKMKQLPGLKDEVHGGPVAVLENDLASGLRSALSIA